MPGALLVVNPNASAVTEARIAAVASVLRPAGIVCTEHPGHATEIVREAAGAVDTVYVFSGDGGFNEALNGVDAETPLGFVPGGGASVLSRALCLPRDPVRAAHCLVGARPRRISVGRVNGRRFGFAAGLGFDAEVVRAVDALGRRQDGRRPGNLAFGWTVVRHLVAERLRLPPVFEVVGHGRAAFVLVANCDPYTYAGALAARVAPRARFELGLDLVAPRRVRPVDVPRLLAYFATGRGQERADDVIYLHDLDGIEVRADTPAALQVDGEDLGDVETAVFAAERDAVHVLA